MEQNSQFFSAAQLLKKTNFNGREYENDNQY